MSFTPLNWWVGTRQIVLNFLNRISRSNHFFFVIVLSACFIFKFQLFLNMVGAWRLFWLLTIIVLVVGVLKINKFNLKFRNRAFLFNKISLFGQFSRGHCSNRCRSGCRSGSWSLNWSWNWCRCRLNFLNSFRSSLLWLLLRFNFSYFLSLYDLGSFHWLCSLILSSRFCLISLFDDGNFLWNYGGLSNLFDDSYLCGLGNYFNYFLTLRLDFYLDRCHLCSLSHWNLNWSLNCSNNWLLYLSRLFSDYRSWLLNLSLWLRRSHLRSGSWLALIDWILNLFKLLRSQTCCQTCSLFWL